MRQRGDSGMRAAKRRDDRRNDRGHEHPAPGLAARGTSLRSTTSNARQQRVRQQGREDTEDDGQLLQRTEASTHCSRGDLCDVGRGNDGRCPDRDTANETPDGEVPSGENANPDPIAEMANSNADSSITRMRPYPSATAPANPRAHSRAQQGNGDDEPRDEGTRLEGLLDGADGAVDDGKAEAEEEAADGCDDRQKENPTGRSPLDTADPSPTAPRSGSSVRITVPAAQVAHNRCDIRSREPMCSSHVLPAMDLNWQQQARCGQSSRPATLPISASSSRRSGATARPRPNLPRPSVGQAAAA